jgi:hypothetical protein
MANKNGVCPEIVHVLKCLQPISGTLPKRDRLARGEVALYLYAGKWYETAGRCIFSNPGKRRNCSGSRLTKQGQSPDRRSAARSPSESSWPPRRPRSAGRSSATGMRWSRAVRYRNPICTGVTASREQDSQTSRRPKPVGEADRRLEFALALKIISEDRRPAHRHHDFLQQLERRPLAVVPRR